MNNPLVGKQITWTWETPFPATFEVDFLTNNQKRSKGRGAAAGYDAIHTYDLATVAPNIYFISWMKESDKSTVSVVLNLDDMKAYGSFTTLEPSRGFMSGVIEQVSSLFAAQDNG